MGLFRTTVLALCAACGPWGALPSRVHADGADTSRASAASHASVTSYEWQRTQKLLAKEGLRLAEDPEGKRIAWVRIVREDVLVRDDLLVRNGRWLLWLNWFHATTKEAVVARELLFNSSEPYRDARIEESMRNLRSMAIFALVRIVAVATENPDEVGVVVYTRDLWSLRLEQAFNVTTQVNLQLRLEERNLFGRNKRLGMDLAIVPKTYLLQPYYVARRVWGTRLSLSENAGIFFNRATGKAEGSTLGLTLGEPFYQLQQRYAYALEGGYTNQVVRRLQNGTTRVYQPDPDGPRANEAFRQKSATASLMGYLRNGHAYKQTLGAGFDYRESRVQVISETALPESLRASFREDVLPRQRRELGPALSYDIWMPRYATFVDLATFGQSENVRVGPSASLFLRAPLAAFGSSTNSWVMSGSAGVVVAHWGGLFELRASARARYEAQRTVDQLATLMARAASPVLGKVRVVARGVLEGRKNDTARTFVTLGADNGLRGYASQAFSGQGFHRMLANFELRTLPIKWHALHVGGVVFYDVGSVFQNLQTMQMHHAAGVGIRFLVPQLSRYPFAMDAGFSADPDFRFVPTIASSQVVPMTAIEDP